MDKREIEILESLLDDLDEENKAKYKEKIKHKQEEQRKRKEEEERRKREEEQRKRVCSIIEIKPIKKEEPKLSFLEKAKYVINKHHLYYIEDRLRKLEENAKKIDMKESIEKYLDEVLNGGMSDLTTSQSYNYEVRFKSLIR